MCAVMEFARSLPEVDADTMLSAGVSTGGFAQVALSADPPKGLKAAISFAGGRGGDGHEHNCNLSGVIDAFHDFGKQTHISTAICPCCGSTPKTIIGFRPPWRGNSMRPIKKAAATTSL